MKKSNSYYIQGLCVICKVNKQQSKGYKNGKRIYKNCCTSCNAKKYNIEKLSSKKKFQNKYRKGYCENCKFIPIHVCQLDLDHIDGNHKNNSPDNLQTLCANCHRLKTYLSKDWEIK